LYCDRPAAVRRRAARTVMNHLFEYLVVWLAPFLSFTAEEAWLARHGNPEQGSVHLQTFPDVPKNWQNEALGKKWAEIRHLRRVVTGAMELARNEKKIGSSLQAKPHIYLMKEHQDLLKGIDFADVCVCSKMDVTVHPQGKVPETAFTIADVPNVGVEIALADGKKCERCWQVLPEVGEHADHPDLCHRCHDAVTHLSKEAA
jgi:isoleucyl-tRNA synthetase